MKYTLASLAVLFSLLPNVGVASTSTDIYSESITRQLSSAEVPQSFASNSRQGGQSAALAENITTPSADSALETADESADAVVKTASKKAPKKSAKRARR